MSTKTERDPRLDPQRGDFIVKMSGTNRRMTRRVVKRVTNDITYRDHMGKERTCWIMSWMDWAREADVEGIGT
jgi:hypothetical protein